MNRKIEKAWWVRKPLPLKSPYILSFATLNELISLQVFIQVNGRIQTSEVVPLLGYSTEGEKEIIEFLENTVAKLEGKSLLAARTELTPLISLTPFAVTPILSCIDLFSWENELPPLKEESCNLEFVVPTAIQSPDKMLSLFQSISKVGKGTIKVKLSSDVNSSIHELEKISSLIHLSSQIRVRLDANQAFTLEGAKKFMTSIGDLRIMDNIDYLEQPLAIDQWESNQELRNLFPEFGLMLDEAVITDAHIKQTKLIGVPFVKLKLFKQGGIEELYQQALLAQSLGLKTVIGNGVASWISNRIEIALQLKYPELFFGASEANGFLKVN